MHFTANESFPTDLDALTFRFEDLPRQLRKVMDDALQGYNLGRSHWRLLAYVLCEEGLTQTQLARRLDMERASAGQAIDALERRGLVARKHKDGDRRVWSIVATDAAHTLMNELRDVVDGVYAQVFSGFSSEDTVTLKRLLDRFAANI